MKRNILSLMLALALLLTLFPVSVGATVAAPTLDEHTAWIKSLAEEQFDAFFAGIDGGSASDAAWELVRHSVRNGGDLNMTVANTKFSRALMNTEMLRAAISHAAAAVHLSSQTPKEDSIYMHGSIHWYENVLAYSSTAVVDDKDEGDEGYAFLVPMIRGRANPYTGPMNDYDEAMYLVVGGCDVR